MVTSDIQEEVIDQQTQLTGALAELHVALAKANASTEGNSDGLLQEERNHLRLLLTNMEGVGDSLLGWVEGILHRLDTN
jgi:hypothetical protein